MLIVFICCKCPFNVTEFLIHDFGCGTEYQI